LETYSPCYQETLQQKQQILRNLPLPIETLHLWTRLFVELKHFFYFQFIYLFIYLLNDLKIPCSPFTKFCRSSLTHFSFSNVKLKPFMYSICKHCLYIL
jgi:hypothetical protein